MKLAVFPVLFVVSLAQIEWLGQKYAETTSQSKQNGLTVLVTDGVNKGTQLKYSKLSDDMIPPVKVLLVEVKSGLTIELQQEFDIMRQTCSCYYVDAAEVASKGEIVTSSAYRIVFQNDDVKFRYGSGYFGIVKGKKIEGIDEPPALPDDTEGGYKTKMGGSLEVKPKVQAGEPRNNPDVSLVKSSGVLVTQSFGFVLLFGGLLNFVI